MVKIIKPSVEILTELDEDKILKHLELCIRNCYKSEDKISEDASSAKHMVKKIIESDHTAMLEHFSITARVMCCVGTYKDLTRHRHASFAIESTRYCNYSKGKFDNEIAVIKPCNIKEGAIEYDIWLDSMMYMERAYMEMSKAGCKPDQMRMLLPHSTAACVVMTANIREWLHIFKLRCHSAAHPSVVEVMTMLRDELAEKLPTLFANKE